MRTRPLLANSHRGVALSLCTLLGVAGLGAIAGTSSLRLGHINSDFLYLPAFLRDLFARDVAMHWHLPPAPYFFPDLLLFFPGWLLSKSVGMQFAVYSVVYGAALLALMSLTLSLCVERRSPTTWLTASCAVWGLVVLCLMPKSSTGLAVQILGPTFHSGALLAGLGIVGFIQAQSPSFSFSRSTRARVTYVVLAAVSILSDLSTVFQALVPAAVTLVLMRRRSTQEPVDKCVLAWLVGAPLLLSLVMRGAFVLATGMSIRPGFSLRAMGRELPTAAYWVSVGRAFYDSMRQYPACWILGLSAFLYLHARVLEFRHKPPPPESAGLTALMLYAAISTWLSVLLPIVMANIADAHSVRYWLPIFILPPVAVAGISMQRWSAHQLLSVASVIASALVLSLATTARGAVASNASADLYPEPVACLDRVAKHHGLRHGVGQYWDAKYATVLSRTGVTINQFDPRLRPYVHISNRAWYFDRNDRTLAYDFLVVSRRDPRSARDNLIRTATERFGAPRLVADCRRFEIFVYDRPRDLALRNLGNVAAIAGGSSQVASPSPDALNAYDYDLTTVEDASALSFVGSARIQLSRPVDADFIDLSISGSDEIELLVEGEHGSSGSTWSRVRSATGKLRVHLIALPEVARGSPISRVEVRAREPHRLMVLGHLFLGRDATDH